METSPGGERADVVVDFAQSAGEQIVLRNDILPLLQFRVSKSTVTDTSSLPGKLKTFFSRHAPDPLAPGTFSGPRPPTDSCSCVFVVKNVKLPWGRRAPRSA